MSADLAPLQAFDRHLAEASTPAQAAATNFGSRSASAHSKKLWQI
jgi:hypothetical protein